MRVTCPGCSGSGKIGDNTCTVCYGSGVVDYPDGNKVKTEKAKDIR